MPIEIDAARIREPTPQCIASDIIWLRDWLRGIVSHATEGHQQTKSKLVLINRKRKTNQ